MGDKRQYKEDLQNSFLGSIEVFSGLFAGQGISIQNFAHFFIWATIGNSIGGVFFVALIKYGHVIRSDEQEEISIEDSEQEPANT